MGYQISDTPIPQFFQATAQQCRHYPLHALSQESQTVRSALRGRRQESYAHHRFNSRGRGEGRRTVQGGSESARQEESGGGEERSGGIKRGRGSKIADGGWRDPQSSILDPQFHSVVSLKRRMASMWSAGVLSPAFIVLTVK